MQFKEINELKCHGIGSKSEIQRGTEAWLDICNTNDISLEIQSNEKKKFAFSFILYSYKAHAHTILYKCEQCVLHTCARTHTWIRLNPFRQVRSSVANIRLQNLL